MLTRMPKPANRSAKYAALLMVNMCLAVLCSSLPRAGATAPAPVTPGESPLAIVPAQAPIVFHIRGVDRVKERLITLVKNALPDLGPVAANQVEEGLKGVLEGRKLQGLDPAGPIFVAFLEMPTSDREKPVVAAIARITKYTDFRDGLLTGDERTSVKPDNAGYERAEIMGHEYFFLDRGAYAVVTPSKEAATLFAKKQPGLDGKLSKEIGRSLLEADVAVYVNLVAVNKEFGEQIKAARQFMETIIETMPAAAGQKQSMEMAKSVYGSIFQMIEDGRAVVLSFDFRPEGLGLRLQAQTGIDTATNKLLKGQHPAKLEALETLPAGSTSYTASALSGELLKTMAPLIYGTMPNTAAKTSVERALDQLLAAGNTQTINAGNIPASGLNVVSFRDPLKGMEANLKLFQAIGEGGTFQNAVIRGKPEIKENAESYRGFTFHYVRLVWDLDKFPDIFPGGGDSMKAAIKKLIGEDAKNWFGTDGKRFVAVMAKDWSAAKAQLDKYLDATATLAHEPAFAVTRKHLPTETSMLMLADAGKFTQVMADYMIAILKAVPGLPINLPDEVKPVATKTSYLGFAVTLQTEHGALDIFVPAVAVQEIRKVLLPLFGS